MPAALAPKLGMKSTKTPPVAQEETQETERENEESKDDSMSVDDLDAFPFEVERATLFSKSVLWEQMRRFYESQGVEAWSSGIVPFFITCNAFIAKSYAKCIHAYLCDLLAQGALDASEPVVILELGVGSGKFSFLVVKALLERFADVYGHESEALFLACKKGERSVEWTIFFFRKRKKRKRREKSFRLSARGAPCRVAMCSENLSVA